MIKEQEVRKHSPRLATTDPIPALPKFVRIASSAFYLKLFDPDNGAIAK